MTVALYVFWLLAAVYAWALVGYPALMAVLGRAGKPRRQGRTTLSRLSLIIPAHNEESVLQAKLENALGCSHRKHQLEILVASDGSTDRTVEIARGFEGRGVRVLDFPMRRGKASVLNDAVRAASGDVVCLCDANVMFQPDALRRLAARLEDPRVGAASGDVRLASDESDFGRGERLYYWLERSLQLGESRVGSMIGVDGGMYVLRKELFRPLPPDTILDDFTTTMNVIRQGKRVVYEPAAVATENGTPSSRDEFGRRVRVTAGAVQSIKRGYWPPLWRPIELWQYVSHKLLRWLGPVWLVLLLVSSAALWDSGMVYRTAFAAQAFFYLLAGAAALWPGFRKTHVGGAAFYFVMSHVAMAVGLVKGLLNLQPGAWKRTKRTAAPGSSTVASTSP